MNEINDIRRQFQNGNWRKFINSVTISKIRGWDNRSVRFMFPICALVGENGTGKSTILRAVVCSYENNFNSTGNYYPSKLFLDTRWDAASVPTGSTITYEIKEGNRLITDRNWKKTKHWGYSPKGKRPLRPVSFLDISRTLPLDATAGYAKIAKQSVVEMGKDIDIDKELMMHYSNIMGATYTTGRFINANNKEIGLLTREYGEITQFHQGAGEDSLLDLMKVLQKVPEQALLVIDEVEASLHPKAQRRLVNFLTLLARKKKIQVIMSTHSPYILEELPPEGRILIQRLHDGSRDIQYGVSSNYAMDVIDDEEHPELYIYVEDRESKILLSEILKRNMEVFARVKIMDVGDAEVVKAIGKLCRNNKLPNRGIAVLDGDAGEDVNSNCLYLPMHNSPEVSVFSDMQARQWNNLDERFGIGAGTLYAVFEDAVTHLDHHKITEFIGNRVRKSKDYVWNVFAEEWCKQCLDEAAADELTERISAALMVGYADG
jgi:predicted ATPase